MKFKHLFWMVLLVGLSLNDLFGQRKALLLDHRDQIRVTKLGLLNSPYRETNLSITPDGKYLYYMSLRGGQHWSRTYMAWGADSVYDGDIWFTEKVSGKWQRPKCLSYGVNTEFGEDEPNISPNGRRVYYQSWRYPDWLFEGGPYFQADFQGGKWGESKGLGGGITEFFKTSFDATDGMAISPDGQRFIVACGYDYRANMDLYMSEKGPHGWSYCKRLGISTAGNERSAFIAADGRTLYFASDGYGGYGGLDIFKTTINADGTFGEVINLGKPFNTAADDYGFILTGDGSEGYFIRNGDIHFADLTNADPRMKPSFEVSLKGHIRDSLTRIGVKSTVILMDARTKRIVKRIPTDNSGKYVTSLPNKNALYDQVIVSDGYPSKKRRIRVTETGSQQSFESNFYLGKPKEVPLSPPIVEVPSKPAQEKTNIPVRQPQPEEVEKQPEKPVVHKPPIAEVDQMAKPDPVEIKPEVSSDPAEAKVEEVDVKIAEDPYSFDGIAENNLILLLDVSASMGESDKLPLLKEAIKKLVTHLRAVDRISVVTYSDNAAVILDGVSAAQQTTINYAIDHLGSSGATRSKSALKKAYKVAENHFIRGGNNRIILATDGHFDITDLYGLAEKNNTQNVNLSIFSFGKMSDRKAELFEELANLGKGNHANISPDNVNAALLREAKAVRK